MNWEAIGAIGELCGAAGVIVTLVYLSTQIRQNSRALMAQGYDEKTRALREITIFSHTPEQIAVATKLQDALNTDVPLPIIKTTGFYPVTADTSERAIMPAEVCHVIEKKIQQGI